jgi:transcriptional regulator with XRE-family HTH domain
VNIGRKMREIREDLGMSQAELARRAGVARNTVVLIEANKRTPSVGLLETFAHLLRTEPAELVREPTLTRKDEPLRGARPEERKEAQLLTWRNLVSSVMDTTAESGEEVPAVARAMAVRRLLEEFLEEWGSAVSDDPEVREAQEQLRAVSRQLTELMHSGKHTPLSSEQESALRMFLEHLVALLEPSPFTGLEEERHGAEANRWIDYLDTVTERWLPLLWRALRPLEDGLSPEEVRQISREATDLARLYIERRGAVRRGCSAEQREALDNLEEALEQVLNLSATQFEELSQKRQHEQQGIPNLTEVRKAQEERQAAAAVFHHVRQLEFSA